MLAGLILITSVSLPAQELRTGICFDRMILAKVEFQSKFEVRKTFVAQNAWYTIFQAGLEYKIIKQVSIAGSFRYSLGLQGISEAPSSLYEKMRYTLEMNAKSKRNEKGLRLKYRLRYQHSDKREGKSRDYLRNKLMVDYKFSKEMSPFAAAELYYRFGENEFQKFRLYLGADIKALKRNTEVYYIMEGELDDTYFLSYHMVGFCLKL